MTKSHNIILEITNNTNEVMYYQSSWFDSGRVSDNFSIPEAISPFSSIGVQFYEKDISLAGCSGYITYILCNTLFTVAFSNPVSGRNKLGVGLDGKDVWNNMSFHNYDFFEISMQLNNSKVITCICKCTGGETNHANITINDN
ncbi:hypothetical protein [Chryseobacterium sp.]|uniref:hypothetical protein n=1 Tax=Chryseobacterium sp. TaxID=1871047 RepID=UPI0031CFCF55